MRETRTTPEPEYLRVPHVAELLSVPPATIYRWVGQRRLPGVKVGNVVLVSRQGLDAFLTEHSTT